MAGEEQATILIVEDDPGAGRLQQIRLERAGYRVLLVETADDALTNLTSQQVDLLLLDQNLPGEVSGLDLYSQVQTAGHDVPAILVTALAGDSIILEALRAGVYDFIPKTPDYLDYLLPAMKRVLDKRRTEYQLAESEAQLAGIIASAMDAVLTVDEQQRIGLFNPAAEQMFGLPAADAQGRPVAELLPAWSTERPVDGPDDGRHSFRWETEAIRSDGVCFPVEMAVSWMETPRRNFWTCLARDIRERRRAQEERDRLVREQTARREAEAGRAQMEAAALENARLYHELRQADHLKDEFLAMLAHELRNPLAPIGNALNLIRLAAPRLDADLTANFAVIERQANHLVRLVDDLLDVNRIRQGKIQLRKEPVLLADIVARAVESSQPLIDARRHRLQVEQPAGPLPLDADPVRLVQVVANLLNNAAKYTPEGGRIDLLVDRTGPAWVQVRVRDTGMGIPAEMLPRLFDVFTQSERTLDRAEGGLGIGLTLVRRLTEMHGGSVQVRSAGPGQGSEFTVRLPLAARRAAAPTAPASQPRTVPVGRRVLIVDDNRDSALTLARLLNMLGHEVGSAHTGPDALTEAERLNPEIILLDIGLPGMDGYEVAQTLRAQPRHRRTVLIALTGYGSPEDRRRSHDAGFHAHLVKPVDLDALQQMLADPEGLLGGVDHPQASGGR